MAAASWASLAISSACAAISGANYVQENAPETLSLKRQLFALLDTAADKDAVLAIASSAMLSSSFA